MKFDEPVDKLTIREIGEQLNIIGRILKDEPNNNKAVERKLALVAARRILRAAGPHRRHTLNLSDQELDLLISLTSKHPMINDRLRELRPV